MAGTYGHTVYFSKRDGTRDLFLYRLHVCGQEELVWGKNIYKSSAATTTHRHSHVTKT